MNSRSHLSGSAELGKGLGSTDVPQKDKAPKRNSRAGACWPLPSALRWIFKGVWVMTGERLLHEHSPNNRDRFEFRDTLETNKIWGVGVLAVESYYD